ncbi:hypothetical protein J2A69_24690 [Burkholderia pseudomallei]|uniref:hypothetical protein n=1 Tax=Burkholderia pseudomallei TaxID=28450 RepID=UPI001A96C842|nr:hypothetical protein [Burkholderia pseudomallei]QSY05713.1 hypothetical protein J1906_24685 [Burkholderia pseudomallei]QSY13494.1 hypothetical protein J2A69_24690 [Burkholderia pseudomallei]QTB64786.1 hypothetical protein J3D99_13605 [Burkholderia pseudomallei]
MRAAALVYPKNAPARHRAIRFRHFSRRREPANDSRVASSIARMTHANSFSNAPRAASNRSRQAIRTRRCTRFHSHRA